MKILFTISLIGFPILYGMIRMYYWDLGRMFSRDEVPYDPNEIYNS